MKRSWIRVLFVIAAVYDGVLGAYVQLKSADAS